MSRYDPMNFPPVFPMGLMRHLSHPKPPRETRLIMSPMKTAKDALEQARLDVAFSRAQSTAHAEAAVMTSIAVLELLLAEIDRLTAAHAKALEDGKRIDWLDETTGKDGAT